LRIETALNAALEVRATLRRRSPVRRGDWLLFDDSPVFAARVVMAQLSGVIPR
jgi:hypothetical protein